VRARYLIALLVASPLTLATDLILHNGKVVTVDSAFSIAEAIAITANRIEAVGSNREILRRRGPTTRLLDLRGRMVLPGLMDSHVHPLGAALSELREPLPVIRSIADAQDYILRKAASTPKGEWIIVPRTFPPRLKELRMPRKEDLDVTSDHPVLFDASYTVIVNSKALEVSGITRQTPDPPGGEIVRDRSGEPNGMLRNAQQLLKGLKPRAEFSETERLQALREQLERYRAAGLTTVIDRALSEDELDLYDKLRRKAPLPVRVTLTWRPDASGAEEDLVRRIQASRFQGIFKLTLDGGMSVGTAYMRAPYGEFSRQLHGKTRDDDRGQLFIPPDKLYRILRAARDKGWSLTAHAQGGAAVDVLLDAFEKLNQEKPIGSSRSHVLHGSFQSPEAIARMRRLGILADIQTAWLYFDAPAYTRVFSDREMRWFIPLRSLIENGIVVASGSDHMTGHDKNRSTNPYNPFLGLWTSVTRKMADGRVLHPEERISREDALKTYTIWGAYMAHKENEVGSIEPGKFADLVVIDRDYLTCPEDTIREIEPVMVFFDGHRER
jgi:predicted amidohydrolase YtcJ